MRTPKIEAMRDVVTQLHETERALDEALTATAALSALLPAARLRARLAAMVGQDAMESAMKAQRLIVEAGAHIVTTHHQLNDVKSSIGLRTVAFGGGYEKPLAATADVAANEDVAA